MRILTVAMVLFLAACKGPAKISDLNFSNQYSVTGLQPAASVYHDQDQSSLLQVSVDRNELLYKKENDSLTYCRVKIAYRLYSSVKSPVILDSSSVIISDGNQGSANPIFATLQMKTVLLQEYACLVIVTDLNRQLVARIWLWFDKSKAQSREFYQLIDFPSGRIKTTPFLNETDTVTVNFKGQGGQAFIRCYFRDFPIASPPFAEKIPVQFNYAADSIYKIDFYPGVQLNFPRNGFYHIQFDTLKKAGLTLFRFDEDYPHLTNAGQLIEVLRYITNKNEYDKMKLAIDKKRAVDLFWIELSGSTERARTLIKKYYSRVERANSLFSTHQQGWKTDRGMIYLIFGKPASVYVYEDMEEWSYGSYGYSGTLSFVFEKIANPFSDSDYILRRNPFYEQPWYRAVSRWREGVAEND